MKKIFSNVYTYNMFEQELENLLQKNWSDEERALIVRLMDNVMYYKKLIPKSLKHDIFEALKMCNILKMELEMYKTRELITQIEKKEEECDKECDKECKRECKCEECKCEECKCEECKCEECKCEN
jgi:hypothetical protein